MTEKIESFIIVPSRCGTWTTVDLFGLFCPTPPRFMSHLTQTLHHFPDCCLFSSPTCSFGVCYMNALNGWFFQVQGEELNETNRCHGAFLLNFFQSSCYCLCSSERKVLLQLWVHSLPNWWSWFSCTLMCFFGQGNGDLGCGQNIACSEPFLIKNTQGYISCVTV